MNGSSRSTRCLPLALLAAIFLLAACGATMLQVKADMALQSKSYPEALSLFQEILKTDPDNLEALNGLGETHLRMGNAAEAVAVLEKAHKLYADRRTIVNLGYAYSQTGEYGKAIAVWDVLLARETDSNVANFVRRHRTLALYKDADLQAKQAVAQERELTSRAGAGAGKAAPPAVSAPADDAAKTAKRPARTARRGRTVKPPEPAAVTPPAARAEAPARERAVAARLDKAFPVDGNTVAVSLFGEKGDMEKTRHLRKALAAMIITDLSKAQGIQVVERIRMQRLLDELKLGQSGIVNPATSPRVGRLLGAGKIVSGNMLGAEADNLHILRILTNVSTGREMGNQDAQGPVNEFFKMQKAIVFGILKDMGLQLSSGDEAVINRYATQNFNSLLLYGEGLDLQDMGEWDQAIKVFQRCALMDPMGVCAPALAAAPSSADAAAEAGGFAAAAGNAAAADNQAAAAAATAAGAGGGGCFLPETLVLTAEGARSIADIREGDRLLTRNDQGEIMADTVARTIKVTNDHHFILNGTIRATGAHRFSTPGGWVRAMDLKIGDRIVTNGGATVVIVSKQGLPGAVTVHNLQMTSNHNYFVSADGKTGVLVHNSK
jgi:tetratricopeptide (TPR) repeat protein